MGNDLTAQALTITSGTLNANTNGLNVLVSGAIDLSGGTFSMSAGKKLTCNGAGARDLDPGGNTLRDLETAGTAVVARTPKQ